MAVEASAQQPATLTLDDVFVVDVDVHAHETPTELAPFTEAPWRTAVENAARLPRRYLDIPCYAPGGGGPLPGAALPSLRGAREEIVWTADQLRRDLDAFAIDAAVIFPDFFLKIAAIPNPDYAAALARSYHRWIAEKWVDRENDLYGVIVAIHQDPDEAVREIERWAGHPRFAAVFLPTCQVYPLWGHRRYYKIFEAAQAADLPVALHSVSGSSWGFPFNVEQFTTAPTGHTASHVFAMMSNVMSFLENGVPVRFPKLRILFCEAGLTWVPFLRLRLDKEFTEQRRVWPYYDDLPSKWIDKMYFATQPIEEPPRGQDLVDLIRIYNGENTTLFASDWPHHDFDHPRAAFDLPLSDEAKRKIMGTNALRVFPKITVPAKYRAMGAAGRLAG
ncbi:MAG TPA: amidohydrolase family protein [Chloroflexota bacterium]|nr:amidohydrolase family protein [Chloroflexota bacterium]